MGFFNRIINVFSGKGSDLTSDKKSDLIYRLSWFELQIAPDTFRLAAIPQQPILLYKEPEGDSKGAVLMINKQDNMYSYDFVYSRLDQVVTKLEIMAIPQQQAEIAFADAALEKPSLHLRFRFADGRQWASVYSLEKIPPQINDLLASCRELTQEVFSWGGDTVSAKRALNALKEAAQTPEKDNPNIILKVNLRQNGEIDLNGKPSDWSQFLNLLDELVLAKGVIWYSRENAESDPDAELSKKMEAVLTEITKRSLAIKLVE